MGHQISSCEACGGGQQMHRCIFRDHSMKHGEGHSKGISILKGYIILKRVPESSMNEEDECSVSHVERNIQTNVRSICTCTHLESILEGRGGTYPRRD